MSNFEWMLGYNNFFWLGALLYTAQSGFCITWQKKCKK